MFDGTGTFIGLVVPAVLAAVVFKAQWVPLPVRPFVGVCSRISVAFGCTTHQSSCSLCSLQQMLVVFTAADARYYH
jgi:hypothetical protein